MTEVPIYVFCGFLESGKTRFLCETLDDPNFTEDERTLIILTEEGIEEPEQAMLTRRHAELVTILDESELNPAHLMALAAQYQPDRIMLEYNGMWKIANLQHALPEAWVVYQIITLVDASTFTLYSANMGALMLEHIANADLVVLNRATDELKETLRARNLRAMNPRATFYFEDENGNPDEYMLAGTLPYDMDAPIIEISDLDYGTWYIDAMNDPDKYQDKTVKITGMVYKGKDFPADVFVPGRFGMVCCADDITFVGFLCHSPQAAALTQEDWVTVTATVKTEYYPEFRGNGPVLYAQKIEPATKADPELVYFNS